MSFSVPDTLCVTSLHAQNFFFWWTRRRTPLKHHWTSTKSNQASASASRFITVLFCFTFCFPNTVKKKKVKLSRYTPWRHMGGGEVQLLLILNLGTRWGWVVSVTSRPRFTPGERTPGTHWTGSWVGPRASLDAEARKKIICLCRGSNPDRPARSQIPYWLSYTVRTRYQSTLNPSISYSSVIL
jgi:hypothetical protein